MFGDTDNEKFLGKVALKVRAYSYLPGDKIMSYGDRKPELYLIMDGYCQVRLPVLNAIRSSCGEGVVFFKSITCKL